MPVAGTCNHGLIPNTWIGLIPSPVTSGDVSTLHNARPASFFISCWEPRTRPPHQRKLRISYPCIASVSAAPLSSAARAAARLFHAPRCLHTLLLRQPASPAHPNDGIRCRCLPRGRSMAAGSPRADARGPKPASAPPGTLRCALARGPSAHPRRLIPRGFAFLHGLTRRCQLRMPLSTGPARSFSPFGTAFFPAARSTLATPEPADDRFDRI